MNTQKKVEAGEAKPDKLYSFHFSLGNSSRGPIGFCARVVAATPGGAVQMMRERIEAFDHEYQIDGGEDYLCVYFNPEAVSLNGIDFYNEIVDGRMSETELTDLSVFPPEAVLFSNEQCAVLEQLRGAFAGGHTDDDIRNAGKDILETLGLRIVVVWAYDDMWGFGGDSDIFIADAQDRLYEMPEPLSAFLSEKGNRMTLASLAECRRGKRVKRPGHRDDFHNWAWRMNRRKELR